MKKTLLFAMALSMASNASLAENQIHFFGADGDYYTYGFLNRVSSNGKWAVGADDAYETGAYLVEIGDAVSVITIKGGELYDVSDDGVAVGALYENLGSAAEPINYKRGAIYSDGKWEQLPYVPQISAVGQYYARCISPDGKYIGGMINCKSPGSDVGGKYYPALWTRNDATGQYEVECYSDMDIPEHYGFFVSAMTPDGRTLAGLVFSYAGSTVPALCVDGKVQLFNEMEWKEWQWSDGIYETSFVDGITDGSTGDNWFNGNFAYISGDYVFGHRSLAQNVDEATATGEVVHMRTIYNLKTEEFVDEPSESFFSAGLDAEHKFFTRNNTAFYMNNSKMQTLDKAFSLTVPSGLQLAAVYGHSTDGKAIAGSYIWFNDVLGQYIEAPMLITLDEPLVEIASTATIQVDSEPGEAATYDIMGRKVEDSHLLPGLYIRNGKKILVK